MRQPNKRFLTMIIAFGMLVAIACLRPLARAQDKKDPFVSIIDLREKEKEKKRKGKIDQTKIVVKGIIANKQKAVAIINDELVSTGDTWHEFKVEKIDKNNITLSDAEDTYVIPVTQKSEGATAN